MSLNKSKVFQQYIFPNGTDCSEDKWQRRGHTTIQDFMEKHVIPITNEDSAILNITSVSNSYGLSEKNVRHFDTTIEKSAYLHGSDTDSRENLLFSNEVYDIVVCTGSVLNDADPMEVFQECSRVLRPGGLLVFEFENSNTLELLFTKDFNKRAVFVNVSGHYKQQRWHYSDSWINELLVINEFEAIKKHKFRYSFSGRPQFAKNENRADMFFELDPVIRFIPFARNFASNTIVLCQKNPAS